MNNSHKVSFIFPEENALLIQQPPVSKFKMKWSDQTLGSRKPKHIN